MGAVYKAISWNKYKVKYDVLLWTVCLLYVGGFIWFSLSFYKAYNLSTAVIRAFGTLAILLLHVVLLIGPASRINARWLPLLYNRRHLGVTTFVIAALHGVFSVIWYHGHGNVNALLSVFVSNTHYGSLIFFPFQTLGVAALLILAAMAFTSHDFWLSFLGPVFWKGMHMMVYVAYLLIMMHVALGIIQLEKSPLLVLILWTGFLVIAITHLVAASKESKKDHRKENTTDGEWEFVCTVQEIAESRAKIAVVEGERVAVFKYDGRLSAVHNVCKHQLGPLGEGKILDGCIVCPWHGFQYRPEDGRAPAPFTEKLQTYRLRLQGDAIYVNVQSAGEGVFVEPLLIDGDQESAIDKKAFFIGWNPVNKKRPLRFALRAACFLGTGLLILAWILSSQQSELSHFAIDYDHVKEIEGWLMAKPVPMLRTVDRRDLNGNPLFKNILLVDGFKRGADATVKKYLGGDSVRYVSLKGYSSIKYISCGKIGEVPCDMPSVGGVGGTEQFPLMEIENGNWSFQNKQAPMAYTPEKISYLGPAAISGEILDAKCYLGAMSPGFGKTHMSCAIRCISGGIMPMVIYKVNGVDQFALLLGEHGESINKEVLSHVGGNSMIKGDEMTFGNYQLIAVKAIYPVR